MGWYAGHARPLPWRDPSCTPWGVLVSEVMSQQTPVARVAPVWLEWMERWPRPSDLAQSSPADVVRAWKRLGYPRRALRLREAALALVERHGGEVPNDEPALRALPGVGDYTAAAVTAFGFGARSVVVDTNVRRVLARLITGRALPAPALTSAERALAASMVPPAPADAAVWSVAVMELGAVVCTARAPACGTCPVSARCAWALAGFPPHEGPPRRGQAWHGTDRQVRGAVLQRLRESEHPVPRSDLGSVTVQPDQLDRAIASLIEDGLLEPADGELLRLPL
ncbi:MAG: A/G-specific adenine glycosylase [Ornithinibacter sp.]